MSQESIRLRHVQRQKKRKKIQKRRRMTLYSVVLFFVILIVLFFTPLFNIKNIQISGNNRVDTAVIKQAIGSVEEDNLFRLNKKKIVSNIKTIPYIDDVQIKKVVFPTGLKVKVAECQPIGYVLSNDRYVILDKNMKVLEARTDAMEGICEIQGIEVTSVSEGALLATDDSDKLEAVIGCVSELIGQDLISGVGAINFTDMNSITFTYQNRLDVICGSSIDFAKKIGMFKKAVNSSKLTENSRGTIDISVSGKAIYTP